MKLNDIIAEFEANGFTQDKTISKKNTNHILESEHIMVLICCPNSHSILIKAEYKDSFYSWNVASFEWVIDSHTETKEINKYLTKNIILTLSNEDTAKKLQTLLTNGGK